MAFVGLIFKNLWRHKTRTLLTLLGVSIGIATIVALRALSAGLRNSMSSLIQAGKADFVVAQANAADLGFSVVDEKRLDEIRTMSGVDSVEGSLFSAV